MRRGPAPQREPMDFYFSAPRYLTYLDPSPSRCFSIGRLPLFGADPLRSATIHPVPRKERHRDVEVGGPSTGSGW